MRIAALHVGDELLDGRVADANLRKLGAFAASHGATVVEARFVPDDVERIAAALRDASADVIVCSGGLGPTDDDRTRHAAARWAEVDLVRDDETLQLIKDRFASRKRTFTANNSQQALFPAGATIIPTDVGTAAGFSLEVGSRRAYFFPGVPREFRWFLEQVIEPILTSSRSDEIVRTLHFHGVGESSLEERIGELGDVIVGFRADYPIIEVKLRGAPADVDEAVSAVMDRAGDFFVSMDETVVERLGSLLVERAETVTTAESCTAGKIAAELTEISGSSAWFERGFVAYSNDAKSEMLGVVEATLERFGAVSPQVAAQMALGALEAAGADWSLAVSGIAGPTGGTTDKPVGTVDFALASSDGVWVRRYYYGSWSRSFIRSGTVYTALQLLLWALEGSLESAPVSGPFSPAEVRRPEGIDFNPAEAPT